MSLYDNIDSDSELDSVNNDSTIDQRSRIRRKKSELFEDKKYRDWFVEFAQELNNIYREFPKSPSIANHIKVGLKIIVVLSLSGFYLTFLERPIHIS